MEFKVSISAIFRQMETNVMRLSFLSLFRHMESAW